MYELLRQTRVKREETTVKQRSQAVRSEDASNANLGREFALKCLKCSISYTCFVYLYAYWRELLGPVTESSQVSVVINSY